MLMMNEVYIPLTFSQQTVKKIEVVVSSEGSELNHSLINKKLVTSTCHNITPVDGLCYKIIDSCRPYHFNFLRAVFDKFSWSILEYFVSNVAITKKNEKQFRQIIVT